jgi:hypothetical protein
MILALFRECYDHSGFELNPDKPIPSQGSYVNLLVVADVLLRSRFLKELIDDRTVATVKGAQSHVTRAFALRTFLDSSHVTRRSAHLWPACHTRILVRNASSWQILGALRAPMYTFRKCHASLGSLRTCRRLSQGGCLAHP